MGTAEEMPEEKASLRRVRGREACVRKELGDEGSVNERRGEEGERGPNSDGEKPDMSGPAKTQQKQSTQKEKAGNDEQARAGGRASGKKVGERKRAPQRKHKRKLGSPVWEGPGGGPRRAEGNLRATGDV